MVKFLGKVYERTKGSEFAYEVLEYRIPFNKKSMFSGPVLTASGLAVR